MAVELADERISYLTLEWVSMFLNLPRKKFRVNPDVIPAIYSPFRPERVLDPSAQHHTNFIRAPQGARAYP